MMYMWYLSKKFYLKLKLYIKKYKTKFIITRYTRSSKIGEGVD